MKIAAINIRNGNVLEHQGKLWVVLKFQIIQPGKGASVIQVDMRDLDSGNKTSERWRTQETVDRVRLDEIDYQFLFADDDHYTFMQTETYEQIALTAEQIGDQRQFLQDGMVVSLLS